MFGDRETGPSSALPARVLPLLASVLALGAIALTAIALGAPSANSAVPVGRAAQNCNPGRYPGLGYFTSLSVSGVSCSTGRQVEVAYYHCRTHSSVKGHCSGGVLGYSCTERRQSIPTEIDARVTCRKGRKTVVHTFQQDT